MSMDEYDWALERQWDGYSDTSDDERCGPDCCAVMCCPTASHAAARYCGCGGGLDHSDCPIEDDAVTEDDVSALCDEAEAAGDDDMVELCMTALGPTSKAQQAAWRACVEAIKVARAMDDDKEVNP